MSIDEDSPTTEPAKTRRGQGTALIAGLGIAGLVGGGAFAVTQILAGGGDQPDSVLPGSAAVYARFDMDPSAGQKVAALRFVQNLDEDAKARLEDGQWREWVWEQLDEEGATPDGIEYETDIEPWLGDRVGLAVIPDGGDQYPIVAVALQVKDGEAALDALDRITGDQSDKPVEEQVGYYLADDYVVLTQMEKVDALKAATGEATLADNTVYTADMDTLGDPGIASMWTDVGKAAELSMGPVQDPSLMNPAAAWFGVSLPEPDGTEDAVEGRFAATLRLTEDTIEMHGFGTGTGVVNEFPDTSADTRHLVNELPADTAVAFGMEHGNAWVHSFWDQYEKTSPDAAASITQSAEDAGVTLPDDVAAVMGTSLAVGVGPSIVDAIMDAPPTNPELPQAPVAYRASTDADTVLNLLTGQGIPPDTFAYRDDDGVLTLGMDQAYVDAVAAGSGDTLGETATYQAAVAGFEDAEWVGYVNVDPFEQYYLTEVADEDARAALETLGAFGWSSTVEGDDVVRFTVRFVADQE